MGQNVQTNGIQYRLMLLPALVHFPGEAQFINNKPIVQALSIPKTEHAFTFYTNRK